MNYTYPQSQNAIPQRATQPAVPASTPYTWNTRIRPVSSIEEVRAYPIDFDGSVFYFPDIANKKIYTKQINGDGTASLNMYELKEIPTVEQAGTINTSLFITREEFEEAINQLKMTLTPPEIPQQQVMMAPKDNMPNNVMQF